MWNFLLALVFQTSSSKSQIWVFWIKNINFLIFKSLTNFAYTLFEDVNFKSDIVFQKFWAQMPKFGHFGSKSINILILTKFRMYPISNVLILNLILVFQNFSILDQNVLTS